MARKLADRRYGRPGKASHRLVEQVLRRMPLFGREGDASSPVAVHIYMREMAVTGEPYRQDYVAQLRRRDGKVVYFREWFDPVRLLTAFQ